ncbi:MAG TPA: 3-oxo-tetronate kinase [Glaciibacter sp.]|nr:3-oxo-tetronate kinase [Glaciibacter sp.]
MTRPLLGVIADDLTGACDVADAIAQSGLSVIVLLGVPAEDSPADADCVVVALKSRTISPADAVAVSTASTDWLLAHGARSIYQKYCSTFDSTDRGNIGPVSDALAGLVGRRRSPASAGGSLLSVGTPATPAVGRTQYLGHLFVGRQLLSESPLRHHPLTPMTDSDLVRVLGRQTPNPVSVVDLPAVFGGTAVVRAHLAALASAGAAHVLVDAVTDDDLDVIADAVMHDSGGSPLLLAGAAGFAGALARTLVRRAEQDLALPGRSSTRNSLPAVAGGRRVIISGSASARSREQAAAFDGPVVSFDPLSVSQGVVTVEDLHTQLAEALATSGERPVLVGPTGAADADGTERVRAVQALLGVEASAEVVERTLSAVASRAVDELGVRSLIVAGGETSGAVAGALGVRNLRLGASAARGVPWMVADTGHGFPVALLLKSGNFGDVDLFTTAWEVAP